jgi:hypothetical protein
MDWEYIRNAIHDRRSKRAKYDVVEWMAFAGTSADEACGAVRAQRTGDYCGPLARDLTGGVLPGGRYLIVASGGDHAGISQRFPAMSELDGELLTLCWSGDFPEATQLRSWAKGGAAWSISPSQNGEAGFEVEGPIPDSFKRVQAQVEARQLEAMDTGEEFDHLWEAIFALGDSLTGFRVDRDPPSGIRFEALALSPDAWRPENPYGLFRKASWQLLGKMAQNWPLYRLLRRAFGTRPSG